MRKSGVLSATILSLLVVAGFFGLLGPSRAESSAKPPTNLKLVGDHWTPWDPPAADPEAYIIQKDDTLWDLSERWLGDPYLWPQIWEENRYILDSHWIYPGDPLVIPGKPTVVPEEGPPPVKEVPTDSTGGYGKTAEGRPAVEPQRPPVAPPPPAPLLILAKGTDVYCSGWIDPEPPSTGLSIVRGELENFAQTEGDVVYLSLGSDHGVHAGDEFAVVRPERPVHHPVTGELLGTHVRRLGKARVMLSQPEHATAVITVSCAGIVPGDLLLPWRDIPLPTNQVLPRFDRYDQTASGGPNGYVVLFSEDVSVVGQGDVVHTDLGAGSGLRPGDVLTVYRPNGELPRMNLGQALVLTVEPETSTVKITESVREMELGDRVEAMQP